MRKSIKTKKSELLKTEDEVSKVDLVSSDKTSEDVSVSSSEPEVKVSSKRLGIDRKILLFLSIFVVIIILLAGFGVYFYIQYQSVQSLAKNSDSGGVDVPKLVDQIGKLIELPKGEAPQVATVSDVSKLSSEEFFSNAQNGDVVLVYGNAKKAYLFRPSLGKLIEVGPVIGDAAQAKSKSDSKSEVASASDSAQVESVIEVKLLNGAGESGLAKKAENILVEKMKNVKVVGRDNAQSSSYDETVVVDLTGKNSEGASKIAEALGGRVDSELPEGEVESGNKIVVILGSNFVK